MHILVSGLGGHMGQQVAALAREGFRGAELTAGVDFLGFQDPGVPCASSFDGAETDVDVVVDFSHHSCTKELLDFCVKNALPLVLATTGQTEEELAAIHEAAQKIPLFFAANYSMGIAILTELAQWVASARARAVPLGASTFRSWCFSMISISASGMAEATHWATSVRMAMPME